MKNIREHKHRLPRECYKGRVRVSFTFCVKDRKPVFINDIIVREFKELLRDIKEKHRCINWVYVFMPDHIHLVLEGKNDESDLWQAAALFKQKTGYYLKKENINAEWQKDFYDHIHRNKEDLKVQIRYILENPVRKGSVADFKEYPYKGSLDFELEDIIP